MDPLERARQDADSAWTDLEWTAAQTHALIAIAAELRAIREQLTAHRPDQLIRMPYFGTTARPEEGA